jgi:2-phosphosulfolactate phosphatase
MIVPMAGAENYGMIAGYAAGERGARAAARRGGGRVVDAFRASTTIAIRVRKGARVIPVASIEEAVDYAGPTAVSGSVAARKWGLRFGKSPTEIEVAELSRGQR